MPGAWQTLLQLARGLSPWELTAVVFAIAYLLLAVKENVWCWFFAFTSTAIYTVLFWDVNLLMDSVLNFYYMLMAFYGWYEWTRGGNGTEPRPLAIRSMTARQQGAVIAATLSLSAVSGVLLERYTTEAWPYVDSFTTWASVITTYLVARKYLQNWIYWIVIDAVSAYLYVERGLNLTALLFAAYVIIAIAGYYSWRRHYLGNAQAAAV